MSSIKVGDKVRVNGDLDEVISLVTDTEALEQGYTHITRYHGTQSFGAMEKVEQLTQTEVAELLLDNAEDYKEYIVEMLTKVMDEDNDRFVSWDAWFRGAEGADLDDAHRGIVYKK